MSSSSMSNTSGSSRSSGSSYDGSSYSSRSSSSRNSSSSSLTRSDSSSSGSQSSGVTSGHHHHGSTRKHRSRRHGRSKRRHGSRHGKKRKRRSGSSSSKRRRHKKRRHRHDSSSTSSYDSSSRSGDSDDYDDEQEEEEGEEGDYADDEQNMVLYDANGNAVQIQGGAINMNNQQNIAPNGNPVGVPHYDAELGVNVDDAGMPVFDFATDTIVCKQFGITYEKPNVNLYNRFVEDATNILIRYCNAYIQTEIQKIMTGSDLDQEAKQRIEKDPNAKSEFLAKIVPQIINNIIVRLDNPNDLFVQQEEARKASEKIAEQKGIDVKQALQQYLSTRPPIMSIAQHIMAYVISQGGGTMANIGIGSSLGSNITSTSLDLGTSFMPALQYAVSYFVWPNEMHPLQIVMDVTYGSKKMNYIATTSGGASSETFEQFFGNAFGGGGGNGGDGVGGGGAIGKRISVEYFCFVALRKFLNALRSSAAPLNSNAINILPPEEKVEALRRHQIQSLGSAAKLFTEPVNQNLLKQTVGRVLEACLVELGSNKCNLAPFVPGIIRQYLPAGEIAAIRFFGKQMAESADSIRNEGMMNMYMQEVIAGIRDNYDRLKRSTKRKQKRLLKEQHHARKDNRKAFGAQAKAIKKQAKAQAQAAIFAAAMNNPQQMAMIQQNPAVYAAMHQNWQQQQQWNNNNFNGGGGGGGNGRRRSSRRRRRSRRDDSYDDSDYDSYDDDYDQAYTQQWNQNFGNAFPMPSYDQRRSGRRRHRSSSRRGSGRKSRRHGSDRRNHNNLSIDQQRIQAALHAEKELMMRKQQSDIRHSEEAKKQRLQEEESLRSLKAKRSAFEKAYRDYPSRSRSSHGNSRHHGSSSSRHHSSSSSRNPSRSSSSSHHHRRHSSSRHGSSNDKHSTGGDRHQSSSSRHRHGHSSTNSSGVRSREKDDARYERARIQGLENASRSHRKSGNHQHHSSSRPSSSSSGRHVSFAPPGGQQPRNNTFTSNSARVL